MITVILFCNIQYVWEQQPVVAEFNSNSLEAHYIMCAYLHVIMLINLNNCAGDLFVLIENPQWPGNYSL